MDPYTVDIRDIETPLPVKVVGDETDLYWTLALDLYKRIENDRAAGEPTIGIVPVGPVYQYRRFLELLEWRPLDLSGLYLFFMDEYLDPDDRWVSMEHPLSFRGFIRRELLEPMPKGLGFDPDKVFFPNPAEPDTYDVRLETLGGAGFCHAGVGITGHLAFNEPPDPTAEEEEASFAASPSRVIKLARDTVVINAHTAFRGAVDRIPPRAVTVGMKAILGARSILIAMNRPWQPAVLRRLLFEPVGAAFPATLVRDHPDARIICTPEVAQAPLGDLQ